jgi:4-carboxymuconolactone decarboxylase
LLLAIANSRSCFRNFLRLPDSLIRFSLLSPKLRELAVMRLAQQAGSEYEWELHVRYALAAGISEAELACLKTGAIDTCGLSELDRLAIQFTDEAAASALTPETFSRLAAEIGEEQVVELVVAIGWWAGLVPIVNAALDIHLTD